MLPWTLLQLADSALPTGGFAHSGGLEAALQLGTAGGEDGLARFVEAALWDQGSLALPFVAAACRAPERLVELDARCQAALPSGVANWASRLQGRAFLRAVAAALPELGPFVAAAEAAGVHAHLAPAFGAAFGRLGAREEDARRTYLFHVARGVLSAAVRLGACGPLEAQAHLGRAGPAADAVLEATRGREPHQAASTSPLLDLVQAQQDRLDTRLFRS